MPTAVPLGAGLRRRPATNLRRLLLVWARAMTLEAFASVFYIVASSAAAVSLYTLYVVW